MIKFLALGLFVGWKYNDAKRPIDLIVQLVCCAICVWCIYDSFIRIMLMFIDTVWVVDHATLVLQIFWLLTAPLVGFAVAGCFKFAWRRIKDGNRS